MATLEAGLAHTLAGSTGTFEGGVSTWAFRGHVEGIRRTVHSGYNILLTLLCCRFNFKMFSTTNRFKGNILYFIYTASIHVLNVSLSLFYIVEILHKLIGNDLYIIYILLFLKMSKNVLLILFMLS